jgi:hypothetical protein
MSSADVECREVVEYTAEAMPEGEQMNYFDYKLTVKLRGFESIIMEVPKQPVKKPVRKVKKKADATTDKKETTKKSSSKKTK